MIGWRGCDVCQEILTNAAGTLAHGQSRAAKAGALFDRRQALLDDELDELGNVSDVELLNSALRNSRHHETLQPNEFGPAKPAVPSWWARYRHRSLSNPQSSKRAGYGRAQVGPTSGRRICAPPYRPSLAIDRSSR